MIATELLKHIKYWTWATKSDSIGNRYGKETSTTNRSPQEPRNGYFVLHEKKCHPDSRQADFEEI